MKTPVIGLIVGNRGFFPDHLCISGREVVLKVLESEGVQVIALEPEDTPHGSVESLSDARKCADLFKRHRDEIDGVLVTLPNFGDERAIANSLRWAELNVPVLIQAFPDESGAMTIADRRDSFCGKMSACNNLKQYGRWAFAEFTDVFQMQDDFVRKVEAEFNKMIEAITGNTDREQKNEKRINSIAH